MSGTMIRGCPSPKQVRRAGAHHATRTARHPMGGDIRTGAAAECLENEQRQHDRKRQGAATGRQPSAQPGQAMRHGHTPLSAQDPPARLHIAPSALPFSRIMRSPLRHSGYIVKIPCESSKKHFDTLTASWPGLPPGYGKRFFREKAAISPLLPLDRALPRSYISSAGHDPAMAVNGASVGGADPGAVPGASTRTASWDASGVVLMGAKQDRRTLQRRDLLPGMVPPLQGQTDKCQR